MAISPARSGQCRGADSRARRRTCNLYKPPSKWQTLPTCHCEERSDVAISQYYVGYHESSGENVTAFPRLHPKGTSSRFALRAPRRFAPRNDNLGECRGAPAPLHGLISLYKALTARKGHAASVRRQSRQRLRSDRRYTPYFGVCRFHGRLYGSEVRSRERHAAPLQWCTPFNDSRYELEVPFRDCTPRALPRASRSGRHVALLLAMTNLWLSPFYR